MQLIDGKQTAATIKAEIKAEVEDIVSKGGKRPHLAAILVGHDGGSETYVRNKVLACEASGKKCVILGRSNIVGKPMAQLMMQKQYGDSTVTVCHSRSNTLKEECRQADIIIAAIGQPGFLQADMVKEGAVVIDVGTTRVPDATKKSGFRLSGDVDFENVAPLCSYITPVPGGVGPMTICMLMLNTLAAGKHLYY